MPVWVVGVLEWAIGLALSHLSHTSVKKELAALFVALDAAVQAADKNVSGPFKGVADEVAEAFHVAVVDVVAALSK